ncbi:hypothetical protein KY348_01925 [Candidatus Woesearchaeota archaeon]|nr:hypothetical protein [Candidatus Woesearchaeota archaeon]
MKIITKGLVLLTALVALFLVTSCTPTETGPDLTQPYIGGTVGLNTYLIEGMPPPMVYDAGNFEFGVGVALENMGEVDIGSGTDNPYVMLRLEGINPEQFGASDADIKKMLDTPLRGARRNFDGTIVPGEITMVTFEPLNYQPDIHGNTQFTIRAVVCYDYETIATSKICIKDDVLEHLQDTSICTLTGEKFPQNSGGPLHVTSLVENPMSENKIQINFIIEHVGIGEFFGKEDGETCDFSARNFNKYYVDIEIEPLQDSGLTVSCSRFSSTNAGRIKLYQGAPTTISCTIERSRPSSGRIYEDLLNIKLMYRYGQFIETPIIIQDVTY